MTLKHNQKGFTLIELLIVAAIIGILAAIAIPAYSTYTKKAKFSEVVNSVNGVKLAIDVCYAEGNAQATCDNDAAAGNDGVIAALLGATVGQYVDTVTVDSDDQFITATSEDLGGSTYTYILTPVDPGSLLTPAVLVGAFTWTATGNCKTAGLC